MRKLYLNRDFAHAKKGTELQSDTILNEIRYIAYGSEKGTYTFFVLDNDVDAFIEAGFIREEIIEEFTRQDMIDFGDYMLDVYNFSDKSSSVNDLVYFLKGRDGIR